MKTYELTTEQLEHGGCKLAELAVEDGHASLESFLNDTSSWSEEVEDLERDLTALILTDQSK